MAVPANMIVVGYVCHTMYIVIRFQQINNVVYIHVHIFLLFL